MKAGLERVLSSFVLGSALFSGCGSTLEQHDNLKYKTKPPVSISVDPKNKPRCLGGTEQQPIVIHTYNIWEDDDKNGRIALPELKNPKDIFKPGERLAIGAYFDNPWPNLELRIFDYRDNLVDYMCSENGKIAHLSYNVSTFSKSLPIGRYVVVLSSEKRILAERPVIVSKE